MRSNNPRDYKGRSSPETPERGLQMNLRLLSLRERGLHVLSKASLSTKFSKLDGKRYHSVARSLPFDILFVILESSKNFAHEAMSSRLHSLVDHVEHQNGQTVYAALRDVLSAARAAKCDNPSRKQRLIYVSVCWSLTGIQAIS